LGKTVLYGMLGITSRRCLVNKIVICHHSQSFMYHSLFLYLISTTIYEKFFMTLSNFVQRTCSRSSLFTVLV